MPLHPYDETPVNVFNRLDNTVGSSRSGSKVRSNQPNGLVMKAVYFNHFRARELRQNAAFTEADGVPPAPQGRHGRRETPERKRRKECPESKCRRGIR